MGYIQRLQLRLKKIVASREIEVSAGVSSILYHYTGFNNALYNLVNNVFRLSKPENVSHKIDPNYKGYYYLSTTRSKLGGYHLNKKEGVIFVLDGNLLNQKYKGMPVDFWKSFKTQHDKKPNDLRGLDEMEDRILSKTPEIPLSKYTKEIHVYAENDFVALNTLHKIIAAAQKLKIPVYEYSNIKDWKQLNKRRLNDV